MKWLAVLFVLCVVASLWACASSGPPRSPEELMVQFRRAHEAHDMDAALKLVYWGEATPAERNLQKLFITETLAEPITSISIETPDPTYFGPGKCQREALEPVTNQVHVNLQPTKNLGSTVFYIAQKDGVYYITASHNYPCPPSTAPPLH